jgi:hypothetical protein
MHGLEVLQSNRRTEFSPTRSKGKNQSESGDDSYNNIFIYAMELLSQSIKHESLGIGTSKGASFVRILN